jgi:hypothetical protein
MAKPHDAIRAQKGVLERLAGRVPGFRGYLAREDRRQADQLLREHGAKALERIVHDLHEATQKAALEEMGEYQSLVTQVEKLRAELRYADRGYSGFFDEVKLGSESALDAVYEKDERIVAQVEEIAAQVANADVAPASLRGAVKRLGLALADRRNAILGLGSR